MSMLGGASDSASAPTVHLTTPLGPAPALCVPCVVETNVTPTGSVSVTTTPVASLGPRLSTVTV